MGDAEHNDGAKGDDKSRDVRDSDKKHERRRRRGSDDGRERDGDRRRRRESEDRSRRRRHESDRRERDDERRSRQEKDRRRREEHPRTQLRVELSGSEPATEEEVRKLLVQWADSITAVHLHTRHVSTDKPGWTYSIADFKDDALCREALDTLRSSKWLNIRDNQVKVRQWPLHGHSSDLYKRQRDREAKDKNPEGKDRAREKERDRREKDRERDARDSRDARDRERRDRDRDRDRDRGDRHDRDRGDRHDKDRARREGPSQRAPAARDRDRPRFERDSREWRERRAPSPPPLLSEEFPHETVVAFDSNDNTLVSIGTEYLEYSDGAAEHIKDRRSTGIMTRCTVCHHYTKELRCRFGRTCTYVHVLPNAVKQIVMRPREGKGGGKMALYSQYERGQRGGAAAARERERYDPPGADRVFNPSDVPLLEQDDHDEPTPDVPHFELCLLVRDVDKDTDARGMRRMTEDDFTKMWCEIEGFASAKLVRDGGKTARYQGTYGLVTFDKPEEAADALSQTFGCGLNVSFYGAEECLEEVATEQQLAMAQRRG